MKDREESGWWNEAKIGREQRKRSVKEGKEGEKLRK